MAGIGLQGHTISRNPRIREEAVASGGALPSAAHRAARTNFEEGLCYDWTLLLVLLIVMLPGRRQREIVVSSCHGPP
ncbi:hypothetical protein ACLOJK_014806 [Asimina triloba]